MDVIIVCHTEFEDLADRMAVPNEDYPTGVAKAVSNLIDIAGRYDAKVTFAVCPEVARYLPKNIKHEIGLHVHPGKTEWRQIETGWYAGDRYLKENCKQSVNSTVLRDYPYEEQLDMIRTGKEYLEEEFGSEVRTFVAGRWSLNNDTIKALIEAGITHDCSAPAHAKPWHYDWSKLPRICMPYHSSKEDYQEKGDLPLLIIPISRMLFAGNVNPEVVPLVGLSWLKACFLEYYKQAMPLFHVCLHSTCMTEPYFISAMNEFLKFMAKHKDTNFKFASTIKEYDKVIPETKILPYLLACVNRNLITSFIKLKILKRK